eukprot:14014654-Alexandrium_andersonii.AAC.1
MCIRDSPPPLTPGRTVANSPARLLFDAPSERRSAATSGHRLGDAPPQPASSSAAPARCASDTIGAHRLRG